MSDDALAGHLERLIRDGRMQDWFAYLRDCRARLETAEVAGEQAASAERLAAVLREQAASEGKPENVQEKIVEGRLKKWLEDVVLLDQKHVNEEKHSAKTIGELRTELAASTGENVVIRRISRFQVGGE